uniref:Reelin domain-containing protein n=1 Tax=Glossina morsitans morsitans TaxID=37546 RepID=A0A1B0GE74_GLOMM
MESKASQSCVNRHVPFCIVNRPFGCTSFWLFNWRPPKIRTNGLTSEHHVDPQTSPVPYTFSGGNTVKSGDKITVTVEGGDFLGFAGQAHDSKGEPIEDKDNPVTKVEFQGIAAAGYKGKVKFVGTVAKDGATFWVRKVLKEVDVE